MSHALSHTPRVHHPCKLSREEQTSTIRGGSQEGSMPNKQRSRSPLAGRGRLPSASDCLGSFSTSASKLTRDCSPSANKGCSHQASTRPEAGEWPRGRRAAHPQAGLAACLGCSPLASSPPRAGRAARPQGARRQWAPPWDPLPPVSTVPRGRPTFSTSVLP